MSFFEHLTELRRRLVRAAVGVVLAFAVAWAFVQPLQDQLMMPLHDAWQRLAAEGLVSGPPQLQTLGPLDHFMTQVRIAVTAALFGAAPIIFYQLWMFVAPGLYDTEKRLVLPFAGTSAVMFLLGAFFCFEAVIPFATEWFLRYPLEGSSEGAVRIVPQYTFPDYTTYTTKLLLAFGLMFELPLGVFFLARAGIVTHRSLLRFWKVSILVIFVVSAVLTPPDPFTLIMMAVPMTALFFASVGVAYLAARPRADRP
jgi:sec-independent protein translocase protein TatC